MPGCGLVIWAEAQQAHEKVQRPRGGWGKGEIISQPHEGCISLELQEKEAQEVPQQLADEVAR